MPAEQLRLMAVHAHPDDESSKGAATMARYAARVSTCWWSRARAASAATCSIPTTPDRRRDRRDARIRRAEMAAAAKALGVRQHWLGFVDSGLPEGTAPAAPAGVLRGHAAGGGVGAARRADPRLPPARVTTYDPSAATRTRTTSCPPGVRRGILHAGDPERYRGWTAVAAVQAYYTHGFSMVRMRAMHERCSRRPRVAVRGLDRVPVGARDP